MHHPEIPCVGVFDSGAGGLSVLKECLRLAPGFSYLYYGDNARAPYGSRPEGEIVSFVREALCEFERRGADAAVLACNTATAVAIDRMRREFAFPIIGVEPAVRRAAREYADALVLCTPRTAESARFRALLQTCPGCRFTVAPLPRLAAAIEYALREREPLALSSHLPPLHPSCVVLGCTHYSLVKEGIADFYRAPVLDGAEGTAKRVLEVLKVGREIHLRPRPDHLQPPMIHVQFLGDSKELNRYALNTNICFQ